MEAFDPQTIAKQIQTSLLRLLARRDHSRYELTMKLQQKKFPPELIEAALQKVEQHGYLNEQRFTENYIAYRRSRGFGPKKIALELKERGIAAALIAEQIDIADNAWFIQAKLVWQKHFKNKQPVDFKARIQQMRFLHARGYTQEQIEAIYQA